MHVTVKFNNNKKTRHFSREYGTEDATEVRYEVGFVCVYTERCMVAIPAGEIEEIEQRPKPRF